MTNYSNKVNEGNYSQGANAWDDHGNSRHGNGEPKYEREGPLVRNSPLKHEESRGQANYGERAKQGGLPPAENEGQASGTMRRGNSFNRLIKDNSNFVQNNNINAVSEQYEENYGSSQTRQANSGYLQVDVRPGNYASGGGVIGGADNERELAGYSEIIPGGSPVKMANGFLYYDDKNLQQRSPYSTLQGGNMGFMPPAFISAP